jgi:phenylpropionate dioxygenase-like ring-hydroxylating dioxygenase large terminal subunit
LSSGRPSRFSRSRALAEPGFLLRDIWYYALPSRALAQGRLEARTLADLPVVFGRTRAGEAFALRDICPHRGIPLSCGRMAGNTVECAYHGWRFAADGTCTEIPSLVPGQDLVVERIRVPRYPLHESQGNIWIWLGDGAPEGEPPRLPGIGDRGPDLALRMDFPCFVDHAVVGLMDPAHGPFVHRSWFWRSRRSVHEKAKSFGPGPLGFVMKRHRPSSNSRAYRLLGGAPQTEISFRLPGIRIEHIEVGRHSVVGLTAVTPVDQASTVVHHLIYWTVPWLTLLKPFLRPIARTFLGQDRAVVVQQQQGLRHDPPLMLIRDADTQARWYFQLKAEWARAREEGRPFQNPVPDTVLRWRS